MDKNKIQILAVEGSKLPSPILEQQFTPFIEGALSEAGGWFAPRGVLETDERFKQLIPYVVMKQSDKYVTYVRGTSGGEARLHGKRSLGLGGHVDIEDVAMNRGVVDITDTVYNSIVREITEEVFFTKTGKRAPTKAPVHGAVTCMGFIYDDRDEVGRVHLGLAFITDVLPGYEVHAKEDSQQEVQLLTKEELLAEADRLEGWSEIFLRNVA